MGVPNPSSDNVNFHLHVIIDRPTYEKLIRVKLATRTPVYTIIAKVLRYLDEEKIKAIVKGDE